jgi:hypothetical protein
MFDVPLSVGDMTIVGLRLQNDFALISRFECSNPLLNSIHAMTVNSFRNNLINGIQSDCPHRERFGYGGDAHATAEAILSNFDNTALASHFFQKRLADFFFDSRPQGGITETSPYNGVADSGLGDNSGPIGWQVIVMKLQELSRARGAVRHRIVSGRVTGNDGDILVEKEASYYSFGDRAELSLSGKRKSETVHLVEEPLVDFYPETYRFVDFLASVALQNGFLIPVGLGDWSSIAPRDVNFTSSVFLFEAFDAFAKMAAARGDAKNYSRFKQYSLR